MGHKFNPKNFDKLDNPARRNILPPEKVILTMGITEGQKVVDLGCGIGYFTFPLAKIVGARGVVYGVDILNEMLVEAKVRYNNSEELSALKNIKFLQSSENVIPLGDHSVDVVLMVNVFHELDEPNNLLKEIKRVLETKGKIFIVDWKKEQMEIGPPIEHRKSMEDVFKGLQDNGYNNIDGLELPPAHFLVTASLN